MKASIGNNSTASDEVFVGYNILLRRIETEHPHHQLVLSALIKLKEDGSSFYIATQNISEFWNVCTRPIENNGLGISVEATGRHLTRFERLFIRLTENEQVYLNWRDLVIGQKVIGVKVHDAKLVALMTVYRIDRLLTFNTKDFKRYAEIEAIDPAEVLEQS
ncbi:MAG: type II toxin-antitoxin system VapC family toxin [Pyrinomonadaceae bacterium]